MSAPSDGDGGQETKKELKTDSSRPVPRGIDHESTTPDQVELWLFQVPHEMDLRELHGGRLHQDGIESKGGAKYILKDDLPVDEILNAFPVAINEERGFALGKGFSRGLRLLPVTNSCEPTASAEWHAHTYPDQIQFRKTLAMDPVGTPAPEQSSAFVQSVRRDVDLDDDEEEGTPKRSKEERKRRKRESTDEKTKKPKDDRTKKPKDDRTKKPKDDRTKKPKDDRTMRRKDDKTKKPKDDKTKKPKDDKTRKPKDDKARKPKDEKIKKPKDEKIKKPKKEKR